MNKKERILVHCMHAPTINTSKKSFHYTVSSKNLLASSSHSPLPTASLSSQLLYCVQQSFSLLNCSIQKALERKNYSPLSDKQKANLNNNYDQNRKKGSANHLAPSRLNKAFTNCHVDADNFFHSTKNTVLRLSYHQRKTSFFLSENPSCCFCCCCYSSRSFSSRSTTEKSLNDVSLPTAKQLRLVLLTSCIPFIGFGFVDNFFMLVLGDYFDTTLCVRFGFSTLAAAAWGNLVSDVLGIKLGESIEVIANRLTSIQPQLSNIQMTMRQTRRFYYLGCAIGMTLGCLLGMVPLWFLDTGEAERRKAQKTRESLFGELTEELANYLHAEKVIVYLVETKFSCLLQSEDNNSSVKTAGMSCHRFINKKKVGCICHRPDCQRVPVCFLSRDVKLEKDIKIDIACGVPGMAYSTRKVVNFVPGAPSAATLETLTLPAMTLWPLFTRREVGFVEVSKVLPSSARSSSSEGGGPLSHPMIRQAIGAPIFGSEGTVIGVIEIRNPINKCQSASRMNLSLSFTASFTKQDKELLISIASHIAVEIEGKRHISNILKMCRRQLKARMDSVKTSEIITTEQNRIITASPPPT